MSMRKKRLLLKKNKKGKNVYCCTSEVFRKQKEVKRIF